MNVFMPCESIEESVRALDDKRLIKQILECKQIIVANARVAKGGEKVGYANHPVVKHYREDDFGTAFLLNYGKAACEEYNERFGKPHESDVFFTWWQVDERQYRVLFACNKRKTKKSRQQRVTTCFCTT